jgi:predicted RND superfamily exporter protein
MLSLPTFVTAGFLGFMDWKISVVSSNFIALLLILTISLTVHVLVKINELKNESLDYKESLVDSVNQMFLPCFFCSHNNCRRISIITSW